ncbi:hypothetical protein FACS1894109_06660 [Spirochaetia bacterium]|nr:hypothetical protein FACS1894109_06660 [Spirochaetia bacterium]
MAESFQDILNKLIKEHGIPLLDNSARCNALLQDYTQGQFKKESRLLLQALEAGYYKELKNTQDPEITKQKLIQKFQDEYGIAKEPAEETVSLLMGVLEIPEKSVHWLEEAAKNTPVEQKMQTISKDTFSDNGNEKQNITLNGFQKRHITDELSSCFFDGIYKYRFFLDERVGGKFYNADDNSYYCHANKFYIGRRLWLFGAKLKSLSEVIELFKYEYHYVNYEILNQERTEIIGLKSEYIRILAHYNNGKQYIFQKFFETSDCFYVFCVHMPEEKKFEYQEIVETVISSFKIDKNIYVDKGQGNG